MQRKDAATYERASLAMQAAVDVKLRARRQHGKAALLHAAVAEEKLKVLRAQGNVTDAQASVRDCFPLARLLVAL